MSRPSDHLRGPSAVWAPPLAAAVLGLFAACAHRGAPGRDSSQPTPVDAKAYYPLEPGWAWAYDVQQGSDRILAITRVIGREGSDEGATAVVKSGDQELRYLLLPDGIARAPVPLPFGEPDPTPDFLLRSPLEPGASWTISGGTAQVVKTGEVVTVPAGTFSGCVVVEESREAPRRLVRTTYAPHVGPVRVEYLLHQPGADTFTTEMRAELRGITRPGDDPLR